MSKILLSVNSTLPERGISNWLSSELHSHQLSFQGLPRPDLRLMLLLVSVLYISEYPSYS